MCDFPTVGLIPMSEIFFALSGAPTRPLVHWCTPVIRRWWRAPIFIFRLFTWKPKHQQII